MEARRLLCTGIRQVGWQTFEVPETPEPHQVVVKPACSAISAGTEIAIYSATHIGFSIPNPPPWLKHPIGLGYSMAGTVHAVGSAVEDWAAGDRVLIGARHGNWAVGDVRSDGLYRLPDGVSMEEGALARLGGISLVGVRQGQVTLGETVAVVGLGLIGQFAAQLSRLAGARPVVGVDPLARRVQVAAAGGIHALNSNDVDAVQAVREITGGRMAEVVIEATGDPQAMGMVLDLAAEGGRVVLLGSLRGKVEIDAYTIVHRNDISLVGAHERLAAHPSTLRDPWTRQRNQDLVLSLLADGSLKSAGLISHRIRPDEIQETYEALIERPQDYVGVLIEWDETE
jgi:2-desacetyl-2-hydroxyethyl bacteriochlorophyllide A dehydrogenase